MIPLFQSFNRFSLIPLLELLHSLIIGTVPTLTSFISTSSAPNDRVYPGGAQGDFNGGLTTMGAPMILILEYFPNGL